MIRNLPDQDECKLLIGYFWDLLAPRHELRYEARPGIDLTKKTSYFARRELMRVHTSTELVQWATKWIDNDDWRRAKDNIRSRRYKQRNGLVRASLRQETKEMLDSRAQALGLPLWQYLACLDLSPAKLIELEQRAGVPSPD